MRFFHYFLTSVSHPLPLGNDSVWLKEIPQLAHEHWFLMHGRLAVSASELQRINSEVHAECDMFNHRGRAIAGLNKALEKEDWNPAGHADAILATCYLLISQSSHMSDGLQDFEVFVRGTALITERIRETKPKTSLNVTQDWLQARLEDGMEHMGSQLADMTLVARGLQALDDIGDSLNVNMAQDFWQAMRNTMCSFLKSPSEGYLVSILSYGGWYRLAKSLLRALQDSGNPSAIILTAAFFGNMILIHLLVPLQAWPRTPVSALASHTVRHMSGWVDAIEQTLPDDMQIYLDWTRSILEMVPKSEAHENALTSTLNLDERIEMLTNMQTKAHMVLGDILKLGSELTSWFEDFVYQHSRLLKIKEEAQTGIPTVSLSSSSSPARLCHQHLYP